MPIVNLVRKPVPFRKFVAENGATVSAHPERSALIHARSGATLGVFMADTTLEIAQCHWNTFEVELLLLARRYEAQYPGTVIRFNVIG